MGERYVALIESPEVINLNPSTVVSWMGFPFDKKCMISSATSGSLVGVVQDIFNNILRLFECINILSYLFLHFVGTHLPWMEFSIESIDTRLEPLEVNMNHHHVPRFKIHITLMMIGFSFIHIIALEKYVVERLYAPL